MFGRFPFAHCHFKIENNLLLGEITFSEKTKVSFDFEFDFDSLRPISNLSVI